MARIQGNTVIAGCPRCEADCSFEATRAGREFGSVRAPDATEIDESLIPQFEKRIGNLVGKKLSVTREYRLFRCSSCGHGGLGTFVSTNPVETNISFPGGINQAYGFEFRPDRGHAMTMPEFTPDAISNEVREAEECLDAGCYRAAVAICRSVVEKALESFDYKKGNLKSKIERASQDGALHAARAKRAQRLRIDGNGVLHDVWRRYTRDEALESAKFLSQVLDDLFDDPNGTWELIENARNDSR